MRLLLTLVFAAIAAFASPSACPTSTNTLDRTFTGGSAMTTTAPSETTAGTDDLTTINTAAGCTAINLTFSNFTQAYTATLENGNPGLSGSYLASTAGTNQDTLLFSTVLADTSEGPPQVVSTIDSVDNTKANSSDSGSDTYSYTAQVGSGPGILSIQLSVNAITVATGGSGTVTIYTCQKGTGSTNPTGATTTQAACNAAVGGGAAVGVFKSAVVTLATDDSGGITNSISLGSAAAYVDVTQVLSITGASTTSETGFLTWDDTFEETPEPATLGLIGVGFVALGFARKKWKR